MSEPFGRLRRFLAELKRRNVYKVAATYATVAFVTLQVARLIFPATTLQGVYDVLVVVAFVGFPLAVVLAWAFDVSPKGVRRTPEAEGEAPVSPAYQWIGLGLVLLLAGVIWYVTRGDRGEPAAQTAAATDTAARTTSVAGSAPSPLPARDRPFVAVLPLENLSPSEDNQFFAAGVHEEILNQLSKVSELGVFARTTMTQYGDTEKSVYEIGQELNAQAVLEGSVQRAGDRVRIRAQLIDPESRDHLWSKAYERAVSTDAIFDIQEDIARNIASSLEAELTRSEERRIGRVPTPDLAAYDAYLKGRDFIWESFARGSAPLVDSAVAYLRTATERDSTFASAHGLLGWAYGIRYAFSDDRRWVDSAFTAARRAEQWQDDVPAAGIARAYTYARADSTSRAFEELRRVLELRPNHEIATLGMFDVLDDQRELGRAIPWGLRAARQTPRGVSQVFILVGGLLRLEFFQQAEAWCERGLRYNPENGLLVAQCAMVRAEGGDPAGAIASLREFLDEHPGNHDALFAAGQLMVRAEKFAEGVEFFERASAAREEALPRESPTTPEDRTVPDYYRSLLGYARIRLGEREEGQSLLQRVAEDVRAELDSGDVYYADDLALLASVHAALGEETEARKLLERAVDEGLLGDEHESPLFSAVRDAPWFQRLSRRIHRRVEAERKKVQDVDLFPAGAEPDSAVRQTSSDE